MELSPEQTEGVAFTKKHWLPKTAVAIAEGRCYREIFSTAIAELDGNIDAAVAIVVKSRNAEWAYCFARYVPGLAKEQVDALFAVVAETNDAWSAYCFARNVSGLTKEQVDALQKI